MTDTVARLREQAASDTDAVEPAAPARALESAPDEADAVGEVLATLAEAGHDGAVAAVVDLLDHEEASVRAGAASALGRYLDAGGTAEEATLAALAERFDDDYSVTRRYAGTAYLAVARDRPAAVGHAVDHLPGLLDPENPTVREVGADLVEAYVETDPGADDATTLLSAVAETLGEMPDIAGGVVPDDGTGVGSGGPAHDQAEQYAGRSQRQRNRLGMLAGDLLAARPAAAADSLGSVLATLDTVEAGGVRAPLVEGLGRAAETDPEGVAPAIETLGRFLDDDDPAVAARTAWTLGILAETHGPRVADAATDHLESLEALLSGEEFARVASAGLLAYVCEHRPEAAEAVTGGLVDLLADDAPRARAAAAHALGYAGADNARPALRAVADDDPDEDVSAVAAAAIERIGG